MTKAETPGLPETFEEFERQMEAAPATRSRRRSKPAEPPAGIEASPSQEPASAEPAKTIPMGGMVEGRWSGVPIWTCPRCRATTFKQVDSRSHTCKTIRMADEADG